MAPIITTATPDRTGVIARDVDQGAIVGRWCRPPLTPDRCYTCFGENLAHYPAEGFITVQNTFSSEMIGYDGRYRHGICRRCRPELAREDYKGGSVTTAFYFSGVKGKRELEILMEAGVSRIMVDQFDYPKIAEMWPTGEIAYDSGAYRVFKSDGKLVLEPAEYLAGFIELWLAHGDPGEPAVGPRLVFGAAADVIGDAEATRNNWLSHLEQLRAELGDLPPQSWPVLVPTWHWGSDPALLEQYLEEAWLVGIGGLVPLMREHDITMLEELVALSRQHLGRFHIFGIAWEKAIEHLTGLVASMDTSKWLDGFRYRSVIFQHSRNKHLYCTPHKYLPEYAELSARELCVTSARNLKNFVEGEGSDDDEKSKTAKDSS